MLHIEIAKRPDGVGVLHCTRQDGSVTWQKQPHHGAHFALHDLTHYAVESTLEARDAFFGLIAQGWEIEDTTGTGKRGELPAEAVMIERMVGLFDTERHSNAEWTLDDWNEHLPRRLTAAEIDSIRALRAELFKQWTAVRPGDKLRLEFSCAATLRA